MNENPCPLSLETTSAHLDMCHDLLVMSSLNPGQIIQYGPPINGVVFSSSVKWMSGLANRRSTGIDVFLVKYL
jgi:hypothetical protein